MEVSQVGAVIEAVGRALFPYSDLVKAIEANIVRRTKDGNNHTGDSLSSVAEETARQELQMRQAEAQAKVAQEIAIARRIEEALEVTLEEYYEYAAEGSLGVKGSEAGLSLGASGSGKRISKRIYKFSGRYANDTPMINDPLNETEGGTL